MWAHKVYPEINPEIFQEAAFLKAQRRATQRITQISFVLILALWLSSLILG
jgi:hypothetical protein